MEAKMSTKMSTKMNTKDTIYTKKSRYIKVYNQLLEMFEQGVYPEGTRLPAEADLSKIMGVSRTTLRQSLALLQEDGFVEAKHGYGNIVRKMGDGHFIGLERIGNPFQKCCTASVDQMTTVSRLEGSTSYVNTVLRREVPVYLGVERNFLNSSTQVGFCYSIIPSDTLNNYNVNLNDKKSVEQYLEEGIYAFAHKSEMEIKYIQGTEMLKLSGLFTDQDIFVLLMENIMDHRGMIVVHNKYYIPLELASLRLSSFA
ncbi:DNA-binding GntR family transcriptional regulator [Paenibacillus shirakamiensis]|uniref:DNA-binding GntR family transcriptional regulator n=1 Tax=Paenibacillus shirakamiensis TaxID=1265935 RepID=A0ABS4JES7_9BACL|nr:winged helix-turn-helix domain-containing protein [Paenibacillus shirakamiensis]MBP2000211.1 DNA-binding GntR family transcriptional regulator [Paenibacillus shirakamiensis]